MWHLVNHIFSSSSYFRFSLSKLSDPLLLQFDYNKQSYKWSNYCLLMIWICKFFPCSYLLCLHCAVIGFSKWLLFKLSITRVTRSSWFLLVCSCFKFIFIKSWNFNRNENGEASPWCLGLLWDTRWVSVLVVFFPAKSLFYTRVINGSASFGDICKDQMAGVSRRGFLCF